MCTFCTMLFMYVHHELQDLYFQYFLEPSALLAQIHNRIEIDNNKNKKGKIRILTTWCLLKNISSFRF